MRYYFSESTIQEPARTEIVLPAFDYDVTWLGVSDLLTTFDVNNTTEFSLKLPIDAPNETFVLAIAWEDEDSITFRFKLWEGGVLHYPIYDGERIGTSARLEIWSVELDHATLDEDLSLFSSWVTEPEVCVCTGGTVEGAIIETTDGITPGPTPEPSAGVSLAIQGYVELRAVTGYVNNQVEFLEYGIAQFDALGGMFTFDSSETTPDDNADYIAPNDLSPGAAGRWVRSNNP